MIAAVDSNVLLDILLPDERFFAQSKYLLDEYCDKGQLVICDTVCAEVASQFEKEDDLKVFLADTGIRCLKSSDKVLFLAGRLWTGYSKERRQVIQCSSCGHQMTIHCEKCGEPTRIRQRILADFMIGAHATVNARLLLTRDRGFYRKYFKGLTVVNPVGPS